MHWKKETALIAGAGSAVAAVTVVAMLVFASDSTTTQTQEGWWNKKWNQAQAPKAEVSPRPAAWAAKALLDKNSPKPWEVNWVPGTGLPGGLSGRTSKKYTGAPEEIAKQFIAEYRPLITGLAPESDPCDMTFQKEGERKDRDYTVVHLQQLHRRIPVEKSVVIVFIDPEGHVTRVVANVHPVGDFDVTPTLDSAAAWEAVGRAIAPDSACPFKRMPWRAITRDSAHLPNPVRLVVLTHPVPLLAYEVYALVWMDGYRSPFTFVLDANSGELLETRSMSTDRPVPRRARPAKDESVQSKDSGDTSHGRSDSVHIYKVPTEIRPGSKLDSLFRQPPKSSAIDRSTMPNPRPYELDPATAALKEKVAGQQPTPKGANSAAWFWSVNFSPDENRDGDVWAGMSFVEWDADTYIGSSVKIYVRVYGRDAECGPDLGPGRLEVSHSAMPHSHMIQYTHTNEHC